MAKIRATIYLTLMTVTNLVDCDNDARLINKGIIFKRRSHQHL